MRRPPKAFVPQDNASPEGIRQAVLRTLRRVAPVQVLLYKPIVTIHHTGPYTLVITVKGLRGLTTEQYEAVVEAIEQQRSFGAVCSLTLARK
jgi:hypothetical protein